MAMRTFIFVRCLESRRHGARMCFTCDTVARAIRGHVSEDSSMMMRSVVSGALVAGLFALAGCAAEGAVGDDGVSQADALKKEKAAKGTASTPVTADCTFTQGYWKNHPAAWPVSSLTLGTVSYSKEQLLAIFHTPVKGNGLISLAHQLIAAKLNVAAGATPAAVSASIASADALIGSLVAPPVGSGSLATGATSSLTGALDSFNNGVTGPGHCGDTPNPPSSSTTTPPAPPPPTTTPPSEPPPSGPPTTPPSAECPPTCGNSVVDSGEGCDDGNTVDGDGCSATCQCECPPSLQ
jgi:cysteine-rich repeat protein